MANIILKDRDGTDVTYAADTVRLRTSDGVQQEFVNASTVPQEEERTVDLNFVGLIEQEILAEQLFEGFVYNSGLGAFRYGGTDIVPASYVLESGKEYTVVWDGEEYPRTTFAFTFADGSECVGVGNALAAGGADSGEPFCIVYDQTNSQLHYLSTETDTSHIIEIYQVTTGVVDMEVTPSASGRAMSKVTVTKPKTLIPGNIAKDVNIGGVVGTFEGGDVHYVTFMSEDGTTELYKRAVLDGNDCADPVDRGLIDTPAKEGEYLKGWATSANSADDENVLKAVTEDRVVYAVCASTFVDGGTFNSTFTWELDVYGALTVSGAGDMSFNWYDVSYAPWHNYRADIKSAVFSNGVTRVPKYALQDCTALTSVTIPDGVTTIGQSAFQSCTALTSITIPDSVTKIESSAFSRCSALASVTLSSGLTSVEASTFINCAALESITIPYGLTSTAYNMFQGCTALTSITIPDSLTTINSNTFTLCTALTSITIPAGVTKIGTYVFSQCTALASVTFADTTTWYIGDTSGAKTTQIDVTNTATNATNLVTTYVAKHWTKA